MVMVMGTQQYLEIVVITFTVKRVGLKTWKKPWNPDYPKGPVPEKFIRQLRELIKKPNGDRCFEICPICHPDVSVTAKLVEKTFDSPYGKHSSMMGSNILVKRFWGRDFIAPCAIFHYVVEHNYQPPRDFIKAVLKTIKNA
jgi:hypothetical protein